MIFCPGVTRHFVKVGERQVHYRRAGQGPVLLMLHQSPKSSREYEALMIEWGRHFTCIAPDTPGYGFSDPLPLDLPELHDFADATCAFLDALNLRKVLVYGLHTGGSIAFLLARLHPERIGAAVANGYVILTDEERADILANYLPPFGPVWDGTHLSWLWARLREQVIFFPWYKKSLKARMKYDMSPPEALHENALELLHAGDHYRAAYAAVFRWKGEDILPLITMPARIVAYAKDPLHEHLERLPQLPKNVSSVSAPTPDDARAEALAFFIQHKTRGDAAVENISSGYVQLAGGQIRMRQSTFGAGYPLLALHDISENGALVAMKAAGDRPILIPDLPGHGLSDSFGGDLDVGLAAGLLLAALDALGIDEVDIQAKGFGAIIALEMKHQMPRRIGRITLKEAHFPAQEDWPEMSARYLPELTPNAHGGHLLEAWLMVRNQRLFRPWFKQSETAIIWCEADIAAADLQSRLIALLDSLPASRGLFQSMAVYPLVERMREMEESLTRG